MLKPVPSMRLSAMPTVICACAMLACSPAGRTNDSFTMVAEIVESYPHDTNAFTQGLVFHEGRIVEGTGRYGESELREVALESGTVLRSARLSREYFGEGITILDDRVFQLTWRSGIGAVYGLDSFEINGTFRYDGEGWGLTHDGAQLIMSDGSAQLRYLDPATFEVVRTLDVTGPNGPVTNLNELEFVRDEIWANVWYQDVIVRIDPDTGSVIGNIDISAVYPAQLRYREDVANGIAYDAESEKIYITGKLWPRLYEIRLVAPED